MMRSMFGSLAATVLLAACGGGGGDAGSPPAPTVQPQVTMVVSNGAGVSGTLVLTLENTRAPVTTANFLAYVNAGFYNGTVIHRNAPGFVLQGGGYAAPLAVGPTLPTEKTTGLPVVLEDNAGLSNVRYSVAMARFNTPVDSATSQFFINLANNTGLDRNGANRGYAVFGSVTVGTALVDAMSAAPCSAWPAFFGNNGDCLPAPNLVITSATQTR